MVYLSAPVRVINHLKERIIMKKIMFAILAVLMVAVLALTAGCDRNAEKEDEATVVTTAAPTAFRTGTWASKEGTNYVFYEDGKSGRNVNVGDGMGVGFEYELSADGCCVFHMGSADDSTKTTVEFIGGGNDTAAITWEDGSRTILMFVNDRTDDFADTYVMGPVTGEDAAATDPEAVIGEWHDAIAGRASMTVTMSDGKPCFEVIWPDSAATYYVFNFLCDDVDEEGRLVYTGGFTGRVDTDSEGNETKTIIDEEAQGTVALTADGTMIWVEAAKADDAHEFVRN